MARIGVFICHCGENISATVDCKKVAETLLNHPGVVFSTDYKYMCSDPGQELIKQSIRKHNLTGVVISACSPTMHEPTFRRAVTEAGLNPYLCEMANIREQCSWVHDDKSQATQKAIEITKTLVEKVKRNNALYPISVPITKRALVIGGGIAGIQAALDIADAGYEVILVEREPSIGGHMAQLSETFPTLDCSQCILTPKMVEVSQHPNITLYTYAELEELSGFIGNFRAKIRLKARFVDHEKCTACGLCWEKCPSKKIPSEFDCNLTTRSAIYRPFPQAIPNKPVIDKNNCIYLQTGKCGICAKVCPEGAIDYSMQDKIIEVQIGAVIIATGFQVQETDIYGEYGYGRFKDVITSLQFERLLSATGPTGGKILRPSDGKEPKTVVFIQCVGSRDPAKGLKYCSKICCMYTAKHILLYKHKVHDGTAYCFYMDIRSAGKGYDEFVRRVIEENHPNYLRGRVSKIYRNGDKLIVRGADTLTGKPIEIEADLIVLATAVIPQPDAQKLAQTVGLNYDENRFFSEIHPKLRPVETSRAGIFLAGTCQAPKDIPDTVAQASAAASKVIGLFSKSELKREPIVAKVNERTCTACWGCLLACPYEAIEKKDIKDKNGNTIKQVAYINPSVCQGCGICVAFCKSDSIDLEGFSEKQIFAQINTL